jgi:hypothetical protein
MEANLMPERDRKVTPETLARFDKSIAMVEAFLYRKPPEVIGSVAAHLVARYLAHFPMADRQAVRTNLDGLANVLIPVLEAEMEDNRRKKHS